MNGSHPETPPPVQRTLLHRAPWVLPVTVPPIRDGGVLTAAGEIMAVGPYHELKKSLPSGGAVLEHPSAALIPGLVNAHTHLELSPLAGKVLLPQPGFSSWVQEIFSLRAEAGREMGAQEWSRIHRQAADAGTCLVGDVTNGSRLRLSPPGHGGGFPAAHVFYEVLGFNRQDLDDEGGNPGMALFRDLAAGGSFLSLGAHAPYSTSSSLIGQAKEWCRRHGGPFSIHCAEHQDEVEFLRHGSGFCRRLLENLGRWVPGWEPPGCSPVQYLNGLEVLDEGTILVHAVHMNREDWRTVARTNSRVCFCPRSNANLNVGRPDIPTALDHGILCALGTDSLASNMDLNLFSEAVFTLENHEGVQPRDLLPMITFNGAVLLQKAHRAGSLQAGRTAAFLAVTIPPSTHPTDLPEAVLYQGKKGAWQWACPPAIG